MTPVLSTATRRVATMAAALTIAATGLGLSPATASGPESAAGAGAEAGAQAASQADRRGEIIARAQSWVDQGVPYDMGSYHPDPDGKQYRTDCSGFVSMAWGLPDSLSTVTLPDTAHPIPKEDLQPGDILLLGGPGTGGSNGHVAIFNGWPNDEQTVYHGLEQAGGTGAVARDIGYPYDQRSDYVPYRLNGL